MHENFKLNNKSKKCGFIWQIKLKQSYAANININNSDLSTSITENSKTSYLGQHMTAYLSVTSSKLNSEVVIIDECEYFVSDVAGLHDVDGFISARVCGSGPVHRVRGPVHRVEDRFNRGH